MTEPARLTAILGVLGAVFAAMALAGSAGVVWWWGVGFDEAEAYGVATRSTDSKMVTSFWIAVVGLAGTVATGTTVVLRMALRR